MSMATQGSPLEDAMSPTSAAGTEQPKLLKLISVLFKEAALDSPTFRAGVNHYNHLIEQTEQWIDGLLKLIRKFPQYYNDFKDVLDISVEQLNPGFLADGLIDQDYTLSALNFTRSGLNILWLDSMKCFRLDDGELTALLTGAKADIKNYKEYRKAFELSQSKYDLYLSRYSAQSKTKEPSALREDAFQLSEVRKAYIHISLEICIALSNVQRSLDSTLVSLSSNLWKDIDMTVAGSNPVVLDLYNQLEKIKLWAKASDMSLKILSKDMNLARKQIEESAIQQFTPSRDLNDHNPALINPNSLLDLKEPVYEKHGWLFMKTAVGKPARQIWVRRWAFVKSGMFGLLNLAPSKTFVQETDKIGVLLCNVRYAAHEDRRFCFEIKTIDTTVVLQAETLGELKYWLRVFATEKKRALEQIDNNSMTSTAFGRYPPLLNEFASTATTTCDSELISGRIEINNNNNNSSGAPNNVITSNNLSHLMNNFNKSYSPDFSDYVPENVNDVQFSKDGVFHEPILNTPISTRLTKAAIVANAFLSPTAVPTAVNANIWGTVNWGMYYLVSPETRNKDNVLQLLVSQTETENTNTFASSIYPPYYPKHLINDDIQMRALFETALQKDEHCLVSFRCIWSPNLKQELSGRCFVTMNNIYFYMNSMGFVSLLMKDLNDLVSVESHFKKNWEILKVYAVDGLNMRAKIFLDNAKLIAHKLEILINNKTALEPMSFEQMVLEMQKIDAQTEPVNKTEPPSVDTERNEFLSFYNIPENTDNFQTDYTAHYDRLVCDKDISLPAKALFHIIFGDNSVVFKKAFTMIVDGRNDGYVQMPWKVTKHNKLQRKIVFELSTNSKNSFILDKKLVQSAYSGILLGKMSELHTINDLADNKYYNISTERSCLELPLGSPFNIESRIVIKATDANSCKLLIYNKVDFSAKSPANNLVANVYRSLFSDESHRMLEQINGNIEKIGAYGKVNKAIKLFGQLGTKVDTASVKPYSIKDEGIVKFGLLMILKLWLKVNTIRTINMFISILKLCAKAIKLFLVSLSINKFLIFLLILSGCYNLWLTGKTTKSYWIAKRTEKMINEYTRLASNNLHSARAGPASNHNGGLMQRAIYMKDIQDMVSDGKDISIDSANSKCFNHFRNNSFVLNYEKNLLLKKHYGHVASYRTAQKLQNTLQEIGIRRNELLIDIKILQKIEKEIALGEWKNWLLNENSRCDFVRTEIMGKVLQNQERQNSSKKNTDTVNRPANLSIEKVDRILPGASELLSYCDSCNLELKHSYLL